MTKFAPKVDIFSLKACFFVENKENKKIFLKNVCQFKLSPYICTPNLKWGKGYVTEN